MKHPTLSRTLIACTLLAGAGLLPLACSDHDTTAPGGRRAGAISPAAPAASVTQLSPITTEALTGRFAFSDDVSLQFRVKLEGTSNNVVNLKEPSNVLVMRITVQPGARFPWHTHPGPVIVSVAQGELVLVYAQDCVRRSYWQKTFVDPGNSVHMAYNPSDTEETVLIATFFVAPDAGPVTIPVPEAQQNALDARCEVPAAGVHAH